jgi:hypothetical protein
VIKVVVGGAALAGESWIGDGGSRGAACQGFEAQVEQLNGAVAAPAQAGRVVVAIRAFFLFSLFG